MRRRGCAVPRRLIQLLLLDTELERNAQRVGYGAQVQADIRGQHQGQGEANIVFNSDSCTRRRGLAGLVAGAALAGLLVPTTAQAAPAQTGCERRNNNEYDKLLECVTLAGVREHQAAFQAIADANDDEFYPGSRRAGTAGIRRQRRVRRQRAGARRLGGDVR